MSWKFSIEPTAPGNAFVGLSRRGKQIALVVPIGYAIEPGVTHVSVLGTLARVLARFATDHSAEKQSRTMKDGFLSGDDGLGEYVSDLQQGSYSKIQDYLALLRSLSSADLMMLAREAGMTTFDPRYISRNLERAIYLPDGTPVFDAMWGRVSQLRRMHNGWAQLAGWVALDAILHLFPHSAARELGDALLAEWEVLSSRLVQEYGLDENASLFTDQAPHVLPQLRGIFDAVDRTTPQISAQTREIRYLLDRLLHFSIADDVGEIWGIKGFYRVWEAACLDAALRQYGLPNIFTCDDELLPHVHHRARDEWRRNRERVFSRNGIARRPDLVVRNDDGTFVIIDFKYSAVFQDDGYFERRPRMPSLSVVRDAGTDRSTLADDLKLHQDIANLETYRWLMLQHEVQSVRESDVRLEIWAPAVRAGRRACKWGVRGSFGEEACFNGLDIVYQSATDILRQYGDGFELIV